MNSLNDTLATLEPNTQVLVREIAMLGARKCFDEDGEVHPVFFHSQEGSVPFEAVSVSKLDDETKPAVWAQLRDLRRNHRVVAAINEVWMVRKDAAKYAMENKVMPRDCPGKEEAVLIQLWEGRRTVTFIAWITRNPNELGEWEVMYDSFFPGKEIGKPEGAMMEGEPYAGEGN